MDFFRDTPRLMLIGELLEFAEIGTRPEPKRIGNRLGTGWRRVAVASPKPARIFDSPLP